MRNFILDDDVSAGRQTSVESTGFQSVLDLDMSPLSKSKNIVTVCVKEIDENQGAPNDKQAQCENIQFSL